MKVSELRERFLRAKGRLAPRTIVLYKRVFAEFEKWTEDWPARSSVIDEFLGSLRFGDSTVREYRIVLRTIGRYGKRALGLEPDPTENSLPVKVEKKRRRYLTPGELVAVVGGCRNIQERALVLVLVDSAMRIGELASLTVAGIGEKYLLVKGKTGERRYRCDPRVVAMLRSGAVDGVVFPELLPSGTVKKPVVPADGVTLAFRVRRIMKRAGLTGEKLGPHTLRHTSASMVARETGSVLAVRALLQHDKVATSELYMHDVNDVLQQKTSPLALMGDDAMGAVRQVGFGETVTALVPVNGGGIIDVDGKGAVVDLVDSLLPIIGDSASIRPRLEADDLRLIRCAFIELMHVRGDYGSGSACVQLMRRMLRRVG